MSAWYVTLADGRFGSVPNMSDETAAALGSPIVTAVPIPYPASPQLLDCGMPSFCWRGVARCGGRTSCPGSSCTD